MPAVAQPALVIAAPPAADARRLLLLHPPTAGTRRGLGVVRARLDAARELRVAGGEPPPLEDDPDRPVAIVFTSGTTGLPKGAVFCERQLDAICEADGGRRFGAGGKGLGSTSMAHLATMTKLPQSIAEVGTTFLMKRWSAGDALRMVERHGSRASAASPLRSP